jgi:hypothetical protein
VRDSEDVCPNSAPGLVDDCQDRPLRDCNGGCPVNGLEVQRMEAEILGQ